MDDFFYLLPMYVTTVLSIEDNPFLREFRPSLIGPFRSRDRENDSYALNLKNRILFERTNNNLNPLNKEEI